jgi:glyoxylase-like metal-dependent hydrolase (beta-lactamase superfamily II)
MALGMLADVQVTGSTAAAERNRSGSARAEIEREGAGVLLAHRALERLHVEQTVDPPADVRLGPWLGVCRPGTGHTDDGMVISLPDEHLLVAGDYLSSLEIPAAHASVHDYRTTLQMLIGVIERERPLYVVVGHGRPHTSEEALRIADDDLDYVEAVIRYAEAGCPPDHAEQIAVPERAAGANDRVVHAANVARACEAAGSVVAQG